MEEKKDKRFNFFWTFFSFFNHFNPSSRKKNFKSFSAGFTLIELIIAIIIFSVVSALLITVLNPGVQLMKGNNAKRQHDLSEVRNSLDLYYDDFNQYPTTFQFGENFESGNNVYMKRTPRDPSCTGSPVDCNDYVYVTNPVDPQWFVLLTKLEGSINSVTNCPFLCDGASIDNPESYNYCVFEGSVDPAFCAPVAFTPNPTIPYGTLTPTQATTPTLSPTRRPSNTPTPTITGITNTPTITLSPTPLPRCVGDRYYYCGCSGRTPQCKYMDSSNPPEGLVYYCTSGCYENGEYQCGNWEC